MVVHCARETAFSVIKISNLDIDCQTLKLSWDNGGGTMTMTIVVFAELSVFCIFSWCVSLEIFRKIYGPVQVWYLLAWSSRGPRIVHGTWANNKKGGSRAVGPSEMPARAYDRPSDSSRSHGHSIIDIH